MNSCNSEVSKNAKQLRDENGVWEALRSHIFQFAFELLTAFYGILRTKGMSVHQERSLYSK